MDRSAPLHRRPRRPRACLAWLLLALVLPAWGQPPTWALDPVHTRVLVAVDHAGFSSALGTVSGATGTLHYQPGDWTGARVEVEIPLARLDFGDADWNRATLARGLLDAAAHPVARFRSTAVEAIDERSARVTGLLQLRGVEREVVLQVRLNSARRHPLPPFRRTVGFSASGALSRRDFGVDAWGSMIGDRVELRIEAEATRSRRAATDDTDAGAAPDADPAMDTDADPEVELEGTQDADADDGATPPARTDEPADATQDLHAAAAAAAGITTDAGAPAADGTDRDSTHGSDRDAVSGPAPASEAGTAADPAPRDAGSRPDPDAASGPASPLPHRSPEPEP